MEPTDDWQVDRLDLDGYLHRVGVSAQPCSRTALDQLHEAHLRTFTFDNIDILLDQHRGVGLDAVQEKFVGRGRGGYCFEHAALFAAVLERLGYVVERRLGRVGEQARTHCFVVVSLDGDRLLADPGFTLSLIRPLPLQDGATDDHGGWTFRLRQVPLGAVRGWALHRQRGEEWELMHTHDELPVRPVDVLAGHHYTSTYPPIHFRNGLIVARHGHREHTTLTHVAVTVRRAGGPTEHRPIEADEVRTWLHRMQVPLTTAEEDRLMERVAELRRVPAPSG